MEKEFELGILESWRPLMIDRDQKSWKDSHSNQLHYDFFAVINGVEGIWSPKTQRPEYKPGEKVLYQQTHKAGNKYPKFTIKKCTDEGKPAFIDRYNDPNTIRLQSHDIAVELTIKAFEELKLDIASLSNIKDGATLLYNWIVKGTNERDVMYNRSNAVRRAVDCIKHPRIFSSAKPVKPFARIIELAEEFLNTSHSA
jgi:hypothetical protein